MAIVEGVPRLFGASVEAPDLRGGAALIVAGLAADGLTEVSACGMWTGAMRRLKKA